MPIGTSDGQQFESEYERLSSSFQLPEDKYIDKGQDVPGVGYIPDPAMMAKFPEGVAQYAKMKWGDFTHAMDTASSELPPSENPGAAEAGLHLAGTAATGSFPLASFKPGVGMFGGRMSKAAIELAEKLDKQGVSPETVKEFTGLERGQDYKWRNEFSDAESFYDPTAFRPTMITGVGKAKLSEVLSHSKLYEAYPELKDFPVFLKDKIVMDTQHGLGTVGSYVSQGKDPLHIVLRSGLDKMETRDALLHEIQHYIQHQEGFTFNQPNMVPKDIKEAVGRAYMETVGKEDVAAIDRAIARGDIDEAIRLNTKLNKNVNYETYYRLATEVEARNTERRAAMPEEVRRRSLGSSTEDIPRHDQLSITNKKNSTPTNSQPPKDQVFYHGTQSGNIKDFEVGFNSFGNKNFLGNHKVLSFSTNPDFAARYAGEKGSIYPVTLDVKNTGDFRDPEHVSKVIKYYKERKLEWLRGAEKQYPEIWTEAKKKEFLKDEFQHMEDEVKHGSWTFWENPSMWKELGFDSAWTRETLGHSHADELNIAVASGSQVKGKYVKSTSVTLPTQSETRDDMTYSILEEKVGKENADFFREFDAFFSSGNAGDEAKRNWDKGGRQRWIDHMIKEQRRGKDYPEVAPPIKTDLAANDIEKASIDWGWFLGKKSEPPPQEIKAELLKQFPSREEGIQAIQVGFGYKGPFDAVMEGNAPLRVLKGSATDSGDLKSLFTDISFNKRTRTEMKRDPELAIGFARAAIAANRNPIAMLGFDPAEMTLSQEGKLTFGGAYNKASDKIWADMGENNATPFYLVHESIHRGFNLLSQKYPEVKKLMEELPSEEYAVRYLMYKMAGDPEKGGGDAGDKQRAAALMFFDDHPSRSKGYRDALDKILKIAADEIGKRTPSGGR